MLVERIEPRLSTSGASPPFMRRRSKQAMAEVSALIGKDRSQPTFMFRLGRFRVSLASRTTA
jgi:hypothetical protein